MTKEYFDDTLDDATHAVLKTFGLSADLCPDTADAINSALHDILRDIMGDGLEEEEDV